MFITYCIFQIAFRLHFTIMQCRRLQVLWTASSDMCLNVDRTHIVLLQLARLYPLLTGDKQLFMFLFNSLAMRSSFLEAFEYGAIT